MSFKTIFLPLAFQETASVVTSFALLLASKSDAHVQAHHVRRHHDFYPPADFYSLGNGTLAQIMRNHDEATLAFAEKLKSGFREHCETANVPIVSEGDTLSSETVSASWVQEIGDPARCYGLAGRASDVAVMALPDAKYDALERELLEAVLFQSGGPLLLLPRTGLKALPIRPLIAWDGSLQASRSARSALPLLREAETVTLLTIGQTDEGTPSPEIARRWLERSGAKTVEMAVSAGDGPVAKHLLDQCEASGSDLLIMGGYSHSRLREFFIGGVTRDMLRHGNIPLLLTH